MKEQEELNKAASGQGKGEMRQADSDVVQQQLSDLAQLVIHVIQALKEEKDVLEEQFESRKSGILIVASRMQTEKLRMDSEDSGVGVILQFSQAILQVVRSGIHILQGQHNQIVQEATDLFCGIP